MTTQAEAFKIDAIYAARFICKRLLIEFPRADFSIVVPDAGMPRVEWTASDNAPSVELAEWSTKHLRSQVGSVEMIAKA